MANGFRYLAIALALLAGPTKAQDVQRSPLASGHPLLGTWRIDLPNGCFESPIAAVPSRKLGM